MLIKKWQPIEKTKYTLEYSSSTRTETKNQNNKKSIMVAYYIIISIIRSCIKKDRIYIEQERKYIIEQGFCYCSD